MLSSVITTLSPQYFGLLPIFLTNLHPNSIQYRVQCKRLVLVCVTRSSLGTVVWSLRTLADKRRGTCHLQPPDRRRQCAGEVGRDVSRATCCCTLGRGWTDPSGQCQACPTNDTCKTCSFLLCFIEQCVLDNKVLTAWFFLSYSCLNYCIGPNTKPLMDLWRH